ncbi:MAG: zinc-dependent alcohol dehydrogenase family protein [Deltaproteobacteria bacterium]|nr:zinc-dependent alcohol dehydrogenase family protein [Deltaproteobacteria bacterium]
MRAMVMRASRSPLVPEEWPVPIPGPGQVRIRVTACAVCRTDLHVLDGDLLEPKLPLVLGHEIVGIVDALGPTAAGHPTLSLGQRVGVPWLGQTCGSCKFCGTGRENLCDGARFTGYQLDGGFAEYALADARYCFSLGRRLSDPHAAPLLCAGLIGYRTLRMAGDAERVGIFGFGAAAHLAAQVLRHQGRRFFAFVRSGDTEAQAFAESLGAEWAGPSEARPPVPLDAALIFAPVGALVPAALRVVEKGGTVVLGGIHMSDIPSFPYSILWGERVIRSVANLTRRDGDEFLALADEIPVVTHVRTFPLESVNEALEALRAGIVQGAAVLVP